MIACQKTPTYKGQGEGFGLIKYSCFVILLKVILFLKYLMAAQKLFQGGKTTFLAV